MVKKMKVYLDDNCHDLTAKKIKVYLDDIRPVPAGWKLVSNFHEAICFIDDNWHKMEALSLDHDISSFYGNKEMTGYDVLMWIWAQAEAGRKINFYIKIHSQNPAGVANMDATLVRMAARGLLK